MFLIILILLLHLFVFFGVPSYGNADWSAGDPCSVVYISPNHTLNQVNSIPRALITDFSISATGVLTLSGSSTANYPYRWSGYYGTAYYVHGQGWQYVSQGYDTWIRESVFSAFLSHPQYVPNFDANAGDLSIQYPGGPSGCNAALPPSCPDEPDTDHDGICDRCDAGVNDSAIGKNTYETGSIIDNTSGQLLAVGITVTPPSTRALMSTTAKSADTTWLDPAGNKLANWTCADCTFIASDSTSPAGSFSPCNCQDGIFEECSFSIGEIFASVPNSGGEVPPDGSYPDFTPPEQITDPTEPDVPGEHGIAQNADTPPDPGASDNTLLQSIAQNTAKAADNAKVLSDLLDAEINESNANLRNQVMNQDRTRQAVEDVKNTLAQGYEISGSGTTPDGNQYDASVADPEEHDLGSKITTWIAEGLPLSGVITGSGIHISGADPALHCQIWGATVDFDVSPFEATLDWMGIVLLACSGIYSFKIVATKGA